MMFYISLLISDSVTLCSSNWWACKSVDSLCTVIFWKPYPVSFFYCEFSLYNVTVSTMLVAELLNPGLAGINGEMFFVDGVLIIWGMRVGDLTFAPALTYVF